MGPFYVEKNETALAENYVTNILKYIPTNLK